MSMQSIHDHLHEILYCTMRRLPPGEVGAAAERRGGTFHTRGKGVLVLFKYMADKVCKARLRGAWKGCMHGIQRAFSEAMLSTSVSSGIS